MHPTKCLYEKIMLCNTMCLKHIVYHRSRTILMCTEWASDEMEILNRLQSDEIKVKLSFNPLTEYHHMSTKSVGDKSLK